VCRWVEFSQGHKLDLAVSEWFDDWGKPVNIQSYLECYDDNSSLFIC
jgi:hypothetical protein